MPLPSRGRLSCARLRTLLVSDFHIGARLGNDVLRRSEPLSRLLAAAGDADRLVLLGDIVELMEGRPQHAMAVAEPILRALGRAVGANGEIVVVPGNHDRPLVRAWARRQADALRPDSAVPPTVTPALARLTSWLAPARVRVHYPGVRLGEGIWATHGHYLDWHLMPVSAYGIVRGALHHAPGDEVPPIAYETARRPSMTRATRWMPRPLAILVNDFAELVRASTMPREDNRRRLVPRISRLTSTLLGLQMRRASIPALAHVVQRLAIDADCVIFGHVHRLGPIAGDAFQQWRGPGGGPRVLNTGCWLYEPLLVHHAQPPHPYWPGGAVVIETGSDPRAVGLLDDLPAAAFH
jgi:UDP-2,3-diacylglucosamine pyrophosphatase LpxH